MKRNCGKYCLLIVNDKRCMNVSITEIERTRSWLGLKSEAVVQRCSVKKVLLETSQNSQEIICARVSFLKLHASGRTPFL